MKNHSLLVVYSLLIISQLSCKKFIVVDPPVTSINNANVFSSEITASAVLTGIYARMSQGSFISTGSIVSMSLFPSLSSDELTLFSGSTNQSYLATYRNALTNSSGANFWNPFYQTLFVINSAIEGLNNSNIKSETKSQLLGEAKFLRGFCYFYLVNLYGDVPLALTPEYLENSKLARSPKSAVYKQIIVDLKEAQSLLSTNYLSADILSHTTERVRPTKWAASALLARAYLYNEDWSNAESAASGVISNTVLYDTVPLNDVFLKNSKEAIWQLQPVNVGFNTQEARLFRLPSSGPSNVFPVYLNNSIVNSFETGDLRKAIWIGSVKPSNPGNITYYFPNKYKISTQSSTINTAADMNEYSMVIRLGEMYLIRAEARAQLNKISEAQADLNVIRKRAGLSNTLASDKLSLLNSVLQERKVELFTEWGHRWFDLKRTNKIDNVMSIITPQKGGIWQTTDQLYPIPLLDLQRNSNLVQNPGY